MRYSGAFSASFDGKVEAKVLPDAGQIVMIILGSSQVAKGVFTATNLEISLGTHKHFFSLSGIEESIRQIEICQKNGVDPFASDPVN